MPQSRNISEGMRFGNELNSLAPQARAQYRATAISALERAVYDALPIGERSALIASTTTKEIVVKDFTRDSNNLRMRQCAGLMARSLATSLCSVTVRDFLRNNMRRQLTPVVQNFFADNASDILDALVRDNMDLCVEAAESLCRRCCDQSN